MFAGQCGSGGLRTPSKFEQCSCFLFKWPYSSWSFSACGTWSSVLED